MNLLVSILIFITLFVSCSTAQKPPEIPEPSKLNFKGEPLPDIRIYSGLKLVFFFPKDNDSTLISNDIRVIDAISEFMRVNKDYNVYLKTYMHENEKPDMNTKRRDFVRARITESGIDANRVMSSIVKPLIPQHESDIFSEEELVNARRVEIQVIK